MSVGTSCNRRTETPKSQGPEDMNGLVGRHWGRLGAVASQAGGRGGELGGPFEQEHGGLAGLRHLEQGRPRERWAQARSRRVPGARPEEFR